MSRQIFNSSGLCISLHAGPNGVRMCQIEVAGDRGSSLFALPAQEALELLRGAKGALETALDPVRGKSPHGRFHHHLDRCQQCHNHPFGLCSIGARLLQEAALNTNSPT